MPQVKGKFITMAGYLMAVYKEEQLKADEMLFLKIGKHFNELDAEGFYDVSIYDEFMRKYAEASITGEKAILTLGKNTFPLIKRTVGLPSHINSALDLIKFSAQQFVNDHKGLPPITILKAERWNVILKLPKLGYDCLVVEGVYLGILEIFGIRNGRIAHNTCVKKGDPYCRLEINW